MITTIYICLILNQNFGLKKKKKLVVNFGVGALYKREMAGFSRRISLCLSFSLHISRCFVDVRSFPL